MNYLGKRKEKETPRGCAFLFWSYLLNRTHPIKQTGYKIRYKNFLFKRKCLSSALDTMKNMNFFKS